MKSIRVLKGALGSRPGRQGCCLSKVQSVPVPQPEPVVCAADPGELGQPEPSREASFAAARSHGQQVTADLFFWGTQAGATAPTGTES